VLWCAGSGGGSDWELRGAFFENRCIVGVASLVGRDSLERFILPCIAQVGGGSRDTYKKILIYN
jgi:hypothetical protein